ncbi:Uncharacterised protein [Candidatus Tiddalikarchaeum anstoanum]|nr:Uncharacterised protein [Candidatus Tiddalikarchaeum anstoanum]
MQSWIAAKKETCGANNCINIYLNVYVAYAAFKNKLKSELEEENRFKHLGYPVEKKAQYINSENCFNQVSKVKKTLEDFINFEDGSEIISELLSKARTIYEHLLEEYIEGLEFVRRTRISQLAMLLQGKEVNLPNADLVPKIDLESIYNCLTEYEALSFINNKEKLAEAKKEIDKLYKNKKFKNYIKEA